MIIDLSAHVEVRAGAPEHALGGLYHREFEAEWNRTVEPDYAWMVVAPDGGDAADLHRDLTALIKAGGAEKLRAVVVTRRLFPYGDHGPVAALVAAADRLTSLAGIHLGRPVRTSPGTEPAEPEDVGALLRAYPRLEQLRIQERRSSGFTAVRHESLRELVIEVAGGAARDLARHLADSDLPALEHLELRVDATSPSGLTVADLAPILAGTRLPKLTRLGLHCGDASDAVAAALAEAPVVAQLDTLAVSCGGLTDRGAEALLAGQSLAHLTRLDVRDQGLSGQVAARLTAAVPGGAVDVSTAEERDAAARAEYERAVAEGRAEVRTFAGLPIAALEPTVDDEADPDGVPVEGLGHHLPWRPPRELEVLTRFDTHAWQLSGLHGIGITELLAELAASDAADTVRALTIGDWDSPIGDPPPIAALVAAADRLPNLRALFIGDLEGGCEISWIHQGDLGPLLAAYPRLEVLKIHGSGGLRLTATRHESLRELVVESGGLPADAVRDIAACDLPSLEHLELWLGTPDYGADSTVEDLAPILTGQRLPRLTTLALRNADITDEIAEALAGAPVVAGLHTLDLSLGTLTDDGAEALLAGQPLTHLKRLDVYHHYLSEEMTARIVAELPTVAVDASDRQDADRYGRYVAIGE